MAIPFKPADPTVDGFIARLSGWRAEAVKGIRDAIRQGAPDVVESIKRKLPHYELDGPICFIKAYDTHLNLVFYRGEELDDPASRLSSYGRDGMRHIKIESLETVDADAIAELVRAAVELNRAD